MKTVGGYIKTWRIRQGLNVASASRALGVMHQNWYAWEAGVAMPRLQMLARLCHLMGVTPNEFMSATGVWDATDSKSQA